MYPNWMITCNYPRIWPEICGRVFWARSRMHLWPKAVGLLCQGGPGFRIDCVSTSWGLFQKVGWNWLVVGLKHLGLIYPYLGWFEANVYGMFWDRLKPQGPEFRRQSAFFFATYCSPIIQLSNTYTIRGAKPLLAHLPWLKMVKTTNKFDTESTVRKS